MSGEPEGDWQQADTEQAKGQKICYEASSDGSPSRCGGPGAVAVDPVVMSRNFDRCQDDPCHSTYPLSGRVFHVKVEKFTRKSYFSSTHECQSTFDVHKPNYSLGAMFPAIFSLEIFDAGPWGRSADIQISQAILHAEALALDD